MSLFAPAESGGAWSCRQWKGLPAIDERPRTETDDVFERYLSLWVALCMAAGVILANCCPPPCTHCSA